MNEKIIIGVSGGVDSAVCMKLKIKVMMLLVFL